MCNHKLCKSRNLSLSICGENCTWSGQVRWFCNCEHPNQINSIGLILIRDKFVAECSAKKYSKKSANKLLVRLKYIAFLSVAMVELADAADSRIELCWRTYVLEGDAPLIFVAYTSLTKFEDKFCSLEQIPMPKSKQAAKEAAAIFDESLCPLKDAVVPASKDCAQAKYLETQDLDALSKAEIGVNSIGTSVSRSGRRSSNAFSRMDQEQ